MNQPIARFKAGPCTASIFLNQFGTGDKQASIPRISLQRAYKTTDGKFNYTTSLKPEDLPKAILALGRAYAHLLTTPPRATQENR